MKILIRKLYLIIICFKYKATNALILYHFICFILFGYLMLISSLINPYQYQCFSSILQINQSQMFRFAHQNDSTISLNDQINPETSIMSKQRQTPHRLQQMSECSNQIQTPHFHYFQSNLANESLFDSYHNQFSHKSSQLNKLISTFEDLGIDVEYLEESDAQPELQPIEESLNEFDDVKKTCSLEEKINENRLDENTVSSPNQIKLESFDHDRLGQVKENCNILKAQQVSLSQILKNNQKECQHILQNAYITFANYVTNFMKSHQAKIQKNQSNRASNIYQQNFRKGNDQLQIIFGIKQEKIKKLSKENEYLVSENERLHEQLTNYTSKHQKCKDIFEQYEELLKSNQQNEKKTYELEQYTNELVQKIDSLQWKLKEAQQELHESSQEYKRKYQKMFDETIKNITRKIQAETYYKLKNQYPVNLTHDQSRRENSVNLFQQRPRASRQCSIYRSNSNYLGSLGKKQDFVSCRPANLAQSMPPKIANTPQTQSTQFIGFDRSSYDSSSYSGKSIEYNEREADRIINQIKMMKASKVQTVSSSKQIDYKYPNFNRSKQFRRVI